MNHETTIKRIKELVPSVMALGKGMAVFVNADFGIQGYGNVQCVETYTPETGEISLYGQNEDGRSYNIKTILGHPITLSVVLLALDLKNRCEENNSTENWTCWCLKNTGQICMDWNLTKDNFNDQSEETKTFIGELIKINS